MTEADQSVEAHYERLLGERYTWMMGGATVCHNSAKALLDAAGIAAGNGSAALDLGAGGGYHARSLAELGFTVIAVDTSAILLQELAEFCSGFAVTAVGSDLLDDRSYRRYAPFASILCVGDTLAHLPTRADVGRLIARAARMLIPGGKLVLQFRESPTDVAPQNTVFTTRSERDRIMECVLHFSPHCVWVTDVVHEWTGHAWRSTCSTYPKLRLTVLAIVEQARAAGLELLIDEPYARQRLLVFARR